MARKTTEEKLAGLKEIEEQPCGIDARAKLTEALQDRSNIVVAKAAAIIAAHELAEFSAKLLHAFDRFMDRPEKNDSGCRAKLAIVDALIEMKQGEVAFYRCGLSHVQLEPVYGGRVDTAAVFRGSCAFGLAQSAPHSDFVEVLNDLALLLCDREKPARTNAALAIANYGHEAGIPILRLKILSGDEEHAVIGRCFAALLVLAPADSIPFVAQFLDRSNDALQLEAAAALGDCKREEAVEALIRCWRKRSDMRFKNDLLTFVGLSTSPRAEEFLLELISTGDDDEAQGALRALAPKRFYEAARKKIEQLLRAKGDNTLLELFEQEFNAE